MFRKERNTRIEGVIAVLAILTGWWLKISMIEWCLIIFCIGGVMTAEAINTSIEQLSDFHTFEIDPRIRDIKDTAAGAVLIMAILSILTGAIIFGPKLWLKFFL